MGRATVVVGLVLSGCGEGTTPADQDGFVAATPRALAAVVIDHVDPGEPRRTTGNWSDWNDPPAMEAQVDYGVNPEGTESGESHTVRVEVAALAAFDAEDRRWFECRPEDDGRCEQEDVDGGTLLYRWRPGHPEEEPGAYSWTVVRDDEVVTVSYEGSGLFEEDPRLLDVAVELDDLRAAALDPATSLRTTTAAWQAGEFLDHYEGVEEPPAKPAVVATTPRQLASRVADYIGIQPTSVRRSRLTDLGADAVGAHMEFDGTPRYDPFTVDILTTTGRASQVDPVPCPVQRSSDAARLSCFAWDDDTAATWTLADGARPGVLWIVGAQDDDAFNRVESVALRIQSAGLLEPLFTEVGYRENRLPRDLLGTIYPMTGDLGIGPQKQLSR